MVNAFIFKPGLIIDAFGELRDQQEQVKEDMEVSAVTRLKRGQSVPVLTFFFLILGVDKMLHLWNWK